MRFKIAKRYTDYRELLKDPNVDAVHINTPIPDHAWMSIEALQAGKHVACTVPMATSAEECGRIVELSRRTGLKYMMMETTVYSREFLFVKELYEKGELGRLQFLRASHQQEMAGWPGYWEGLPPMHYATHCVGPVLALPRGGGGVRLLLRLRPDRRAADQEIRLAVRRRDMPHQAAEFRPRGGDHALALQHRPAVSRELRCLRLEEGV